jgi:mRNA interferase RelE/StbE
MLKIDLGKRAEKYMRTLPRKHAAQIATKIFELRNDPLSPDSKQLQNSEFRRADFGEHRIVYTISSTTLFIPLIGKRNDGDVYRRLRRLEK